MKHAESLTVADPNTEKDCAELRRIIETSADPQRLIDYLLPIARRMLAEQKRLHQPKTPEIGCSRRKNT